MSASCTSTARSCKSLGDRHLPSEREGLPTSLQLAVSTATTRHRHSRGRSQHDTRSKDGEKLISTYWTHTIHHGIYKHLGTPLSSAAGGISSYTCSSTALHFQLEPVDVRRLDCSDEDVDDARALALAVVDRALAALPIVDLRGSPRLAIPEVAELRAEAEAEGAPLLEVGALEVDDMALRNGAERVGVLLADVNDDAMPRVFGMRLPDPGAVGMEDEEDDVGNSGRREGSDVGASGTFLAEAAAD